MEVYPADREGMSVTRQFVIGVVLLCALAACAEPPASGLPRASAAAPTSSPTPEISPTTAPSTAPPASESPAPSGDEGPPVGELPAGEYRTHFEPRLTFTLGAGWARTIPDPTVSDQFLMLLHTAGDGGELLFVEVSDLGTEGSLARFERAPLTELTAPEPATVGGVEGLVIEGGLPPTPAYLQIPRGSDYQIGPDDRIRAIAVEVEGATITFIVEGNDDDFGHFLPVAEGVLESVSFG